jgi:hypothetical protein
MQIDKLMDKPQNFMGVMESAEKNGMSMADAA